MTENPIPAGATAPETADPPAEGASAPEATASSEPGTAPEAPAAEVSAEVPLAAVPVDVHDDAGAGGRCKLDLGLPA